MTSTYSQAFSSPPSLWGLYPRILAARKPSQLAAGTRVPRLEARLSRVRVEADRLARYRELCGCQSVDALPIAYPHVLASALHLAILASDRFPVTVLGLVHVANRIEQRGALDPTGGGEIACWLEGYEDTPQGQRFTMHTEWRIGGEVPWRERSDFLARAPRSVRAKASASEATAAAPTRGGDDVEPASARSGEDAGRVSDPVAGSPARTTSFRAPAGLGRRYGTVAGDLNPIHVADLAARAFGVRAAIAHGMWSMARCAAELESLVPAGVPRVLEVQFRKPVFLPSWLAMRSSEDAAGASFALLDSAGDRLHLSGSLRRAA